MVATFSDRADRLDGPSTRDTRGVYTQLIVTIKLRFVIAHGLNLQGVTVTVFRSSAPYDEVDVDVEHTDVNTITLRTTTVPATNAYIVAVSGSV